MSSSENETSENETIENETIENISSNQSSINSFDNEDYFFNEDIESNTQTIDTQSIFNLLNQQNTGPVNYTFTSRQYFNTPDLNYNENIFNSYITNIFEQMYPIILDEVMDYIDSEVIEEVMERTLNETVNERNENDFINFKSNIYKKLLDENKKSKDCSICLVDFEDDDSVSLTNCNHLFHNNCITEWSRYKKDCPICRNILKNENDFNGPI